MQNDCVETPPSGASVLSAVISRTSSRVRVCEHACMLRGFVCTISRHISDKVAFFVLSAVIFRTSPRMGLLPSPTGKPMLGRKAGKLKQNLIIARVACELQYMLALLHADMGDLRQPSNILLPPPKLINHTSQPPRAQLPSSSTPPPNVVGPTSQAHQPHPPPTPTPHPHSMQSTFNASCQR